MRPVSDAFLRILRGSHVPIFRATLVTSYQDGINPAGTDIPIDSGDVTFDASADVRATLDLTVPAEYWPETASDPLSPYGNELYIERGVLAGGGQRQWVGLGYYRIESVEQDEVPDGLVRVPGKDRMAGIIDARLEAPVQFAAGASVQAVFDQLVGEVYPDATIEFDFDAGATTFPGSHIADEDRHEFLDNLVTGLGKTWYWDYRGYLVVRDAPDPGKPVWDVTHGEGGVLVKLGQERTRENVYNIVVVNGDSPSTGTPVRAVARDANPNSPTYYLGRFGKVPRFFSSQLITTQLGAATAAQKILKRAIGLPYSINFTAIANPALEVLDPVLVTYSDSGRDQVHALEKIRIPLSVDQPMTASTKDKTNLTVEVGL